MEFGSSVRSPTEVDVSKWDCPGFFKNWDGVGMEKGKTVRGDSELEVCYYGFCFLMHQKVSGWKKHDYSHTKYPVFATFVILPI